MKEKIFKLFVVVPIMALSAFLLYSMGAASFRVVGSMIETEEEKDQDRLLQAAAQKAKEEHYKALMTKDSSRLVCEAFVPARKEFDLVDVPIPLLFSNEIDPLLDDVDVYFAGTNSWIQYLDGKYYMDLSPDPENVDGPYLECIGPSILTMTGFEWNDWEKGIDQERHNGQRTET